MDLPDGKIAVHYSVFEAVSNSIHAIVDKFGEKNVAAKGHIEIDIETDDNSEIHAISVSDNGIGFTPSNIESFETSDSRYKYTRGGKGVGRLIWIKTFEKISVSSTVKSGRSSTYLTFDFKPERPKSIQSLKRKSAGNSDTGSRITMSGLRKSIGSRINFSSFLKDLSLHFFSQYIDGTLPTIILNYGGYTQSLTDFISDKVDEPTRESVVFDADGESWVITLDHIFIDPTISSTLKNSYILTAHGRLVGDPYTIEKIYDLRHLPNGKAYVAVVSGSPLDQRVDQQRLGFRFNEEQEEALHAAILENIEAFLGDHIADVRNKQRKIVESVLTEHPQLASQIGDLDEYVASLYPGMPDEQIAANLFTLLFREERNLRKKIVKLRDIKRQGGDVTADAHEIIHDLSEQEKRRLADLVAKRHQVLITANELLRHNDDDAETYNYEKVVHDLICPMGRMYTSGDYDDHNLWILDDSLAGYQLFTSDKSIRSLVGKDGSTKEPDLLFFNPLGFRRPDSNDPITIVEFKRPGDGRISSDPISQVLQYIEELRDKTVTALDGEVISTITPQTPFRCFIVCDLTEETKKLLRRSQAHYESPDGEGFYGWAPEHNATLHVLSFKKMFDDAYKRNRAYFDALNLPPPSRAAQQRAAKRRQREAGG